MKHVDTPLAPAPITMAVADGETYYHQLLKNIPRARKRITIASMVLLNGERTGELLKLLKSALKRGVRVQILLDNYTRLPRFELQPADSRKSRLASTFQILQDLQEAGASVYYFGKIGLNPYKGRCHIKVTIVDDAIYAFGGLNFYDEALGTTDFMLRGDNAAAGDCLEQLVERIGTAKPPMPDAEIRLDPVSNILFDGGRPKHSIIYERACELTAQAERVHYVSQMAPSGELARLLAETDATLYFNRPEQMIAPDRYGQAFDQKKYRLANSYVGGQYIHAKFMVFELRGGRRAVISGSNNFSYRGVAYGTQEIGLHSSEPKLCTELLGFMESHILAPDTL
jgi:phosphatidylserine/phosphatidylglycerophosphate/cardiolipin synthase-like enzyme